MKFNLVQAIMYDLDDDTLIKEFKIKEDKYKLLKDAILKIENDKNLCTSKKDKKIWDLEYANIIKYWYVDLEIKKNNG